MENNEIIMYKLYVGLNDKDTKKQEIPTKKAIDIICKCLAKQGITGMTEYLGNGVYTFCRTNTSCKCNKRHKNIIKSRSSCIM